MTNDQRTGNKARRTLVIQAGATQARVIRALMLREVLTRYGRNNIGFMWLFMEPMLFTLAVTALWTFSGLSRGSSMPIVEFAVTGYSSVLLWRNMPARCIEAIGPNLGLLYHRNVKVADIFYSRLLVEVVGASASFLLLGVMFYILGWMRAPEDMLLILAGWGVIAWFGAAMGVLMGSISERSDLIEKIWHPLAYITLPLSGAAFIVSALPEFIQKIVLYFPMVHGVEMVRDGYFGSSFRATYNVSFVVAANVILTLIALAAQRIVSRSVAPE
jgi:ABC-type polysaccharide/polyol phosphate export permease